MALFVGFLFGVAPAWQASRRFFGAGDCIRHADGDAARRPPQERARRRRSRDGCRAAVRRRPAPPHARGRRYGRSRLPRPGGADDACRPDRVEVSDPGGAPAVLRRHRTGDQGAARRPRRRMVEHRSTGRIVRRPFSFEIVGDAPVAVAQLPTANHEIASASYFSTLDLPLVAGRGFNDRDTRENVMVCIVSEAFVRQHLNGRSPLGVRLALRPASAPKAAPTVREIVGVVRQLKARPDETEDLLQIYAPITQLINDDIFLLVRPASGPATALMAPVRAAIGRIDKEQLTSVRDVMTLEEVAWQATGHYRFRAVLVAHVRDAGAGAGHGWRVRNPRLFGPAARPGDRASTGARRDDRRGPPPGGGERRQRHRGRCADRPGALPRRGTATDHHVVRRPTAGRRDVCRRRPRPALTAAASIAGPAWRAARIDPAVALRME